MAGNPTSYPDNTLEAHFQKHGISNIAGIDEAGRGAWAGPVMASAVILPPLTASLIKRFYGLRDSKLLSAAQRQHWDRQIRTIAVAVSVAEASVDEIDQTGVLAATRLAMRRAVQGLDVHPGHLIIDYILIGDVGIDQTAIPHGDARALSIAAASVVTKVARDRGMCTFDSQFPAYGFARHKGYGTALHRQALDKHGPSSLHRRSFAPIRETLAQADASTAMQKVHM